MKQFIPAVICIMATAVTSCSSDSDQDEQFIPTRSFVEYQIPNQETDLITGVWEQSVAPNGGTLIWNFGPVVGDECSYPNLETYYLDSDGTVSDAKCYRWTIGKCSESDETLMMLIPFHTPIADEKELYYEVKRISELEMWIHPAFSLTQDITILRRRNDLDAPHSW